MDLNISFHVSQVHIDIPKHMNKVQSDKLGLFAAQTFKKLQDPYVPMRTGNLANASATVKPWTIWHHTIYAHYQYTGYGFNYYRGMHPQATYEWDKKAFAERGEDFVAAIQAYVDSGALGLSE